MRNENIEDILAKAEKNLRDMKQSQGSGSDNTKVYLNQRATTWDWERTASFSSPQIQESHQIYMKFIADNQQAPQAIMVITCLIDNSIYFTANTGSTSDSGDYYGVWFNGTFQDMYGNYSPDKPTPNTTKEISWYDAVSIKPSGKNIKLKFKVYATDTGTLRIRIDNTLI